MRRRVLGFGDCCYHIVSRINERRFYLGERQKAHFLNLLYASADFSGVEIITFCIMDDHFHLLVRVPPKKTITNKELLRRIQVLYKPEEYDVFRRSFQFYLAAHNRECEHAFRQRFEHRMYNLSEFVRTLKHRFSLWYNQTHDREGPLWTGRFTSVLIESAADEHGQRALSAVAAYIDLNAVRAKLVKAPESYPWCGYTDAMLGNRLIQNGLRYALGRDKKCVLTPKTALKLYKRLVRGSCASKIADFSRGWIIGRASFVDFVARRRPECFKTGLFDITEPVIADISTDLHRIRCPRFAQEHPVVAIP